MMNTAEIQVRSARQALRKTHFLGEDAEMVYGVFRALDNAVNAMEKERKEKEAHENQSEGQ